MIRHRVLHVVLLGLFTAPTRAWAQDPASAYGWGAPPQAPPTAQPAVAAPPAPQPGAPAPAGQPAAPPPPAYAPERPMTEPLPTGPAAMPRQYGFTEQEGAGGRDANLRQAWNTLFIEGLGNAGFYSLNYDRLITENISFRFGGSYFSGTFNGRSSNTVTIPVMVNFLFGRLQHKIELGVGAVAGIKINGGANLYPFGNESVAGTALVGYRYTPLNGGIIVRVGFTPIFGADGFLPWGGVSVGASF